MVLWGEYAKCEGRGYVPAPLIPAQFGGDLCSGCGGQGKVKTATVATPPRPRATVNAAPRVAKARGPVDVFEEETTRG